MGKRKTNDVAILSRQVKLKSKVQKEKMAEISPSIIVPESDSGQYQFQVNDVTSEFDSALMGRLGSKAFAEMSKSDGLISGLLTSYKNLILSCNWTLEDLMDPTPEEQKAFDVLYDWIFSKNNFEPCLYSILKMLEIGFSCFNKYYTPYDKDGNLYMMPVLLERLQQSIWRIDYAGQYAEQITSKGLIVKIPFSDLVFFTFRKEGNDLRGVSLLRQAYYDYKDKKDIKKIAKKGICREMLGLPIGKVPASVKADSPEYEQFSSLLDMLSSRDYTETDDAIILPQGYELDIFKAEFRINDIKEYLGYFDSSMAISVLAQFILLGQVGRGGAYALGADQSNFFMDGLHFIVDYIEGQFTKEVIEPAVKANWANVDYTKFKLRGLNLDKKASKEFADIVNGFITSGVIQVQESDEKQIREMYGLPEINEAEREEKEQEAPVPPAAPIPPTEVPEKEDDSDIPDVEEMPDEIEEDDEEQTSKLSIEDMAAKIEVVEFWKTPKQRNAYIDQQTASLTKYSKASLNIIAEKLMASIRWQLNQGNVAAQGLKDVTLNQNAVNAYKKNMGIRLASVAQKAYDNAKKDAAPHLKKLNAATNPNQLPSKTLTSFIINQSDLAVDKQVTNLKDISLLIANTASTKGYTNEMTLALIEQAQDDFIENGNNAELTNTTSIAQATSMGEMEYYKAIENNLWGYEFANVSPETQICQSLVGQTYATGSAEMLLVSPPLHYRCKSYWKPIYADNEKPEITNYIPPSSILKTRTM